MNRRRAACTGLLATILAAALPPAMAQDGPVSPKEIQDTWPGKTITARAPNGNRITLNLLADGSAKVTVGAIPDSGTWRVSDQGYCATWKTIRAGQERCFTVKRNGSELIVVNPDGSENARITAVE